MKVLLVKKAEYEFSEEKFTAIPQNVFEMISGGNVKSEFTYEKLPEVIMFENAEDYNLRGAEYDFDETKPVYVNGKGQIFRLIKERDVVSDNGSADTETDKGEQS